MTISMKDALPSGWISFRTLDDGNVLACNASSVIQVELVEVVAASRSISVQTLVMLNNGQDFYTEESLESVLYRVKEAMSGRVQEPGDDEVAFSKTYVLKQQTAMGMADLCLKVDWESSSSTRRLCWEFVRDVNEAESCGSIEDAKRLRTLVDCAMSGLPRLVISEVDTAG